MVILEDGKEMDEAYLNIQFHNLCIGIEQYHESLRLQILQPGRSSNVNTNDTRE